MISHNDHINQPGFANFPTVSEGSIDPAEFRGSASEERSRLHTRAHTRTHREHPLTEAALLSMWQPAVTFTVNHVCYQTVFVAAPWCRPLPSRLDSECRAEIHLTPPRGPSSDRFESSSSQLEVKCQGVPKRVTPGAAAPTVTWKWPLPATHPPMMDLRRCTRTEYDRWVSAASRSTQRPWQPCNEQPAALLMLLLSQRRCRDLANRLLLRCLANLRSN